MELREQSSQSLGAIKARDQPQAASCFRTVQNGHDTSPSTSTSRYEDSRSSGIPRITMGKRSHRQKCTGPQAQLGQSWAQSQNTRSKSTTSSHQRPDICRSTSTSSSSASGTLSSPIPGRSRLSSQTTVMHTLKYGQSAQIQWAQPLGHSK